MPSVPGEAERSMRTIGALFMVVLLIAAAQARADAGPRTHLVRPGDTLYRIAIRYGTTVAALMEINGLRSDRIRAGQVLRLPSVLPARGAPPVPRSLIPVPAVAVLPEVGADIVAPRPLRVRRGPKTYYTTLAIVEGGTPLRVLDVETGWIQVEAPGSDAGWVRADDLRAAPAAAPPRPGAINGEDIVREAMRYLGTPYVWGGGSNRGVDCSGFVYVVFSGPMPQLTRRSSFDYFQMGTPVDRAGLRPGDLVFFTTYAPGPSHVGIYAGEGRFLHASSGARRVLATPLGDAYYAARYVGARRLITP
jgi:cell wall-associated NlpC family hydrolase